MIDKYYSILGVDENSSLREIKKAFRIKILIPIKHLFFLLFLCNSFE